MGELESPTCKKIYGLQKCHSHYLKPYLSNFCTSYAYRKINKNVNTVSVETENLEQDETVSVSHFVNPSSSILYWFLCVCATLLGD